MIIVVGEILIDIFPDGRRMGGAPFNFAYHLKQMGLPVRFISRVGQDPEGREIQQWLAGRGFSAADIQVDTHHPTGTVLVEVDDAGVPRFDIRTDVAYDYVDLDRLTDAVGDAVRMIYFGTLVQRTTHGFDQLRRFISRRSPRTACFYDINLRPPHVSFQAVEHCLHVSDILKLNDGELDFLRQRFSGPEKQDDTVNWLMAHFGIQTVALTLGDRGSVLYRPGVITRSGPAVQPVLADTVGAGDAFAAVLALGCLSQLAPEQTIRLAAHFASTICGIRGAVPDDDRIYDDLRRRMKGDRNDR